DLAAAYVAEMVRLEMVERFGELALTDGFEVHTTIDSKLQRAADRALVTGLETYDRNHGYRGRENHLYPAEDGSTTAWLNALATLSASNGQEPAYVQSVAERSFTALLKTGETVTVDWEGIRWAKKFINPSAWGSSPR